VTSRSVLPAAAIEDDLPACHPHDAGCITCGDHAVAMRIVELEADTGLALCVDEDGRSETVDLGLVAPVPLGTDVLVHAGAALTVLTEAAA
jgi:hydrogenase maturation factor